MSNKSHSLRLTALFIVLGIPLPGCSPASQEAQLPPPIVTVSQPIERTVTDYEEFTGRTEAINSVQVRARVNGYLDKILFQDGAEVKQGEVLYEVDPRPYQATLDRDQADLTNKKAVVVKTEAVYKRSLSLVSSGATSREDVENQRADWEVAKATVGQAEARIRSSQLNLDFTKITSPINGRLSRTYLTKGNLVVADSTLLTTIVSLDPIYAYFDVDETTMLQIQRMIREGKVPSARQKDVKVPVFLRLANEELYLHEGYIDFVNNRVESTTGTLQVRGFFPNPKPAVGDRLLSPGMFVRIRVPIGEPHKAVLISERALGTDQGLKFVYVVNDKNEVVRREVTLGQPQDGLQEIADGLKADDRVIVSGLQRVRPGVVVNPKAVDMPLPPKKAKVEG